jgi:hypothetical protein
VSRARQFALSAVFASLCASLPTPLLAQIADRLDAQSDAQDAGNDALLATPNEATPAPLEPIFDRPRASSSRRGRPSGDSAYWLRSVTIRIRKKLNHGGTQTLETSPFGNLSWAAPVCGPSAAGPPV